MVVWPLVAQAGIFKMARSDTVSSGGSQSRMEKARNNSAGESSPRDIMYLSGPCELLATFIARHGVLDEAKCNFTYSSL